jgi:hypothetical protein
MLTYNVLKEFSYIYGVKYSFLLLKEPYDFFLFRTTE